MTSAAAAVGGSRSGFEPRLRTMSAAENFNMTPTEMVLERLRASGKRVRQSRPDQWEAQCPAHEDNSPSLGINESPSGKVLLCCHAGCRVPDICRALDLRTADLFPDVPASGTGLQERAQYRYVDEHGEVLFTVHRYVDLATGKKTFKAQAADGRWTMKGVRRVPYNLPQVGRAVADSRGVYITEGEKDAENLQWHVDGAVTTNPFGAGKWDASYNEHFRGADVTIVADDDTKGRGHADEVAIHLAGVAASVRILLPAEGYKDISDHLHAGRTLAELRPLEGASEPATEDEAGPRAFIDVLRDHTYRGGLGLRAIPAVSWLIKGIIQNDSLFQVFAPSGAGKSFAVIDLAACIAAHKRWHGYDTLFGPVVYVVAEGAAGTADRIDAWAKYHNAGQDPTDLIVITMPAMLHLPEQVGALAEWCAELGAVMVVIDTYARSTLGLDENKNNEAGLAIDGLDTIRRLTGAAVGIVHHTGHDSKSRGRGASALYAAMDTVIGIESDDTSLTMTTNPTKGGKQKNGPDDWTVTLAKFSTLTGRTDEDGAAVQSLVLASDRRIESPSDLKEQPLKTLKVLFEIAGGGPVTKAEWLTATVSEGVSRAAFYRHLSHLSETGCLTEVVRQHKTLYLPKREMSHLVSPESHSTAHPNLTVSPTYGGETSETTETGHLAFASLYAAKAAVSVHPDVDRADF